MLGKTECDADGFERFMLVFDEFERFMLVFEEFERFMPVLHWHPEHIGLSRNIASIAAHE